MGAAPTFKKVMEGPDDSWWDGATDADKERFNESMARMAIALEADKKSLALAPQPLQKNEQWKLWKGSPPEPLLGPDGRGLWSTLWPIHPGLAIANERYRLAIMKLLKESSNRIHLAWLRTTAEIMRTIVMPALRGENTHPDNRKFEADLFAAVLEEETTSDDWAYSNEDVDVRKRAAQDIAWLEVNYKWFE